MAVRPRETGDADRPEAAGIGRGRPGRPASFPRWLAVLFILAIGLILWIGVLSGSSGRLTMPGADAMIYVAAVVGVAALLAWSDRKRGAPEKGHKHK